MHQLEKLEMALQAAVYQRQELAALEEFLDSADECIEAPLLREILDELRGLAKLR